MKTFVEKFLIRKKAEFYLIEIYTLPDNWQEVIQNNREYTLTQINSLSNYSWIDSILVKQELIIYIYIIY